MTDTEIAGTGELEVAHDNLPPTEESSVTTTEPLQTDQPPTTEPKSTEFTIPDEYKDKGWVQKIKTPEDLWKQLDSAQSLIGKKTVIPEFEKEEDKLKYLSENFGVKEATEVAELFGERELVGGSKESFSELFKQAGVSKEQAKILIDGYFKHEDNLKSSAYSEEGLQEVLKASFPKNTEVESENARKILKANIPDADKALVDNLPNDILGLMLRFANTMASNYGAKPEHTPNSNNPAGAESVNLDQKRADIRKAIAELPSRPHTQEDKSKLLAALADTYKTKTI